MNSSVDDGGPAFPVPGFWDGMSLRDVFACAALQGMLADHTTCASPEKFAVSAYEMADAMLAARKGGVA